MIYFILSQLWSLFLVFSFSICLLFLTRKRDTSANKSRFHRGPKRRQMVSLVTTTKLYFIVLLSLLINTYFISITLNIVFSIIMFFMSL